ncbi:MAG: CTP synthase [Bacteroidetes bacterium]|nr:CTP synthase [Bacteroidota bacterium]
MAATKYIFVTGGVSSSLGKGILSASLAKLLQARGYSVTIQKFDPYLNVDPGTMNPYEHGECYVTDDGAETDLDLGHYERFLNIPTSQANNVTTGQVYLSVIQKERKGDYLGKTVQVIPHITDEIKNRFQKLSKIGNYDIIITEIGGTVGDIESLPYVEALRQLRYEKGANNVMVIHLTYIPFLRGAGELKTKPTQHSVKTLLETGVQPDILVCRTEYPINKEIRRKLALFCNVKPNAVIEAIDVDTIYEVPIGMMKEELDKVVLARLKLPLKQEPNMEVWKEFLYKLRNYSTTVDIGLVGKYTELPDAYKSIHEAFIHAGTKNNCKVKLHYIPSDDLNAANIPEKLKGLHGILVAPGFGDRGIEGKIATIKYVRENNIPFFGICLGMQCAVIEWARNVLKIHNAHSREMDAKTQNAVIDIMEEQKSISTKGGTMRLGAHPCELQKGSLAYSIYNENMIMERHRHRYEFNNQFLEAFQKSGMKASGVNPISKLVEIIEIPSHPFFIGTQFHPELKSTVENPQPIFVKFVGACLAHAIEKPVAKEKVGVMA